MHPWNQRTIGQRNPSAYADARNQPEPVAETLWADCQRDLCVRLSAPLEFPLQQQRPAGRQKCTCVEGQDMRCLQMRGQNTREIFSFNTLFEPTS